MPKNLYRVGKPRVVETTDRFDCGRGTGGLGTGIYAYKDLDAAESSGSYKSGQQPIYELPNICKDPLNIHEDLFGGSSITNSVNKAGIAIRCGDIEETVERLSWSPEIMERLSERTKCGDPYTTQCDLKLKEIIASAIKEERDCSRNSKGEETYGSKHCSQPMNHVLRDLGFDCVLPTDRAGGNDYYYGSVILKETIDKHLGRKTVGYEDIDDFGKIILDKRKK